MKRVLLIVISFFVFFELYSATRNLTNTHKNDVIQDLTLNQTLPTEHVISLMKFFLNYDVYDRDSLQDSIPKKIEKLIEEKKYREALKVANDYIEESPSNVAYTLRSRCYYLMTYIPDSTAFYLKLADEDITRALQEYPSSYNYYLHGLYNYYLNNYTEALSSFELVKSEEVNSFYNFYYSHSLFLNDNLPLGFIYINKFLLEYPEYISALYIRSYYKYQIGDYDNALIDLEKVKALSEKGEAFDGLYGLIYYGQQEYEKAIVSIKSFMACDSCGVADKSSYELFLSILYYFNQDSVNAIGILNRLEKEDYNNKEDVYFLRADFYDYYENYELAVKDYLACLNYKINDTILYEIVDCYYELEDYENANKYISKLIKHNFDSTGFAYNYKGEINLELGNVESAIGNFNKAIAIEPNNDKYYLNRGGAYILSGEKEKAKKDFDKTIELKPGDSYYLQERACQRFFQFGDSVGAMNDIDKAIKMDPYVSEYHAFKGVFEIEYKKDTVKAKEFFLNSIEYGNYREDVTYNELMRIALAKNDLENSRKYINAYIQTDFEDAYFCVGEAFFDIYELDSALRYFKLIDNENVYYVDALLYIAEIEIISGKKKMAQLQVKAVEKVMKGLDDIDNITLIRYNFLKAIIREIEGKSISKYEKKLNELLSGNRLSDMLELKNMKKWLENSSIRLNVVNL